MIEIKLSQGAKPGHGGVLPGAKVSGEIARARGVPEGQDCISPARHSAFSTPRGLLEFVAQLRELSGGKPVGFKLAIGHPWEWFAIAKAMVKTGHPAGFHRGRRCRGRHRRRPAGVHQPCRGSAARRPAAGAQHAGRAQPARSIRIGAAGKIVTAFDIARTMAIGADWCNAARGFMFALGCIQSQSCHTSQCPTGVATQDPLRQRALVVPDKAERVHLFHKNTLKALKELLAAAGLTHPDQLGPEHVIRRVSSTEVRRVVREARRVWRGGTQRGRDLEWRCARVVGRQ
jgi:glutamate synthase domain-containing protein 2